MSRHITHMNEEQWWIEAHRILDPEASFLAESGNPKKEDDFPLWREVGEELGRFDAVPQPLRLRGKPDAPEELTPDEVLHRVMLSKNHQHHLAKKDPSERETFMTRFQKRWVGALPYRLVEFPLSTLDRRPFVVDEKKVESLVKAGRVKDDGNYPIVAPNRSESSHTHVILDGNHRVEAAIRRGDKTMKAYVSPECRDLLGEEE
jgi:hypothetical protein